MLVESVLRAKGSGVVTIRAEATIAEASASLSKHRIGALVVVEGDDVIGILSERDIVRGMAASGERVHNLLVRDLMSADVVVCAPGDSLESLMSVMTNRRLRHLPVLDGGKLLGIVTIGDVVKTRLEEATLEAESLRSYVMEAR